MIIYFIYMQHMSHRMQITQERSANDLMTNSVKFIQQTSSSLSESDSSICNYYILHSTYLTHSPKGKARAENVRLWYKYKLADVHAVHWYELHP